MRITKENTAALFVDMQARLIPVIDEGMEVVHRSATFAEGMRVLGIPMVWLHQYPKGLGEIVPELQAVMGDYVPFDKQSFSAMGDEAIVAEFERLRGLGVKNILVCGVESHVCVLQSCIDLIAAGFQPLMVTDCVGSRKPSDRKIALRRAAQEGTLLTTLEAALLELCAYAGTDQFKAISKLIK